MRIDREPSGHVQVRSDKNGRTRSYHAFWWDEHGKKRARRLGPAHVKDTGRRTPRGAVVWRAGDGSRPTPEHLTPKDAQQQLNELLREAQARAEAVAAAESTATLRDALEGWLLERITTHGMKRTTRSSYDRRFGRICRDLGGETNLRDFADGRLVQYFEDFVSEKSLTPKVAEEARVAAKDVVERVVECWTAQPPDSQAVEVKTKGEAVRVAHELKGNWKHRRPGVYRVTPEGMRQPRRVSRATAQTLEAQGWIVKVRRTRHWVELRAPSINNYNKHRTVLNSAFLWAIRRGYIEHNPMAEVPRRSTKAEQQRILTREDFYTPEQVQLLLQFAPSIREEACWLCGAHAGLRLPGEALGLKWGMVDFKTEVIRPYGNWVLNEDDTTKTPNFTPIPMTPRLIRTLKALKQRRHDTGEDDYVFAGEGGRPMSGERLRERFVGAVAQAGLPRIPMYNLRHSFGTALAADGVPIRTIQALMRHSRIGTTEKYMAYAPQPELAGRIASALEPKPTTAEANASQAPVSEFLQKLEEEIPAKWLREVERIFAEGHMPLPTEDVTELQDGDHKLRGALAVIDTAIS